MNKNRNLSDKVLSRFANMLEFPEDVIRNVPKLYIVDNLELRIENSLGVVKYTAGYLKVKTPRGNLIVDGRRMIIKAIMPGEIIIKGEILNIQLDFRGGS